MKLKCGVLSPKFIVSQNWWSLSQKTVSETEVYREKPDLEKVQLECQEQASVQSVLSRVQ